MPGVIYFLGSLASGFSLKYFFTALENGIFKSVATLTLQIPNLIAFFTNSSGTSEEKEQAGKDMGRMLDYIDKLGELDTDGVEPMSHVFPVKNVFREDIVINGDMREEILKNAPGEKDGMFVVPRTFE